MDINKLDYKIFVGNVPYQCTQEEFQNCFKNFVGYKNAEIIRKYNSDAGRGFGFVTFDSVENGNQLINQKENQNIILKDRILRFSKKKHDKTDAINKRYFMYVSNIPEILTSEDFKKIFELHDDLGLCYINTDRITGKSKGTGIVEFKSENIYNILLLKSKLDYTTDDNNKIILQLSPMNNRMSTHSVKNEVKQNYRNKFIEVNTKNPVYIAGFNAGRNLGFKEGLKACSKFRESEK